MKKKILFFYTVKSSFVKKDIDLLMNEYEIIEFLFRPSIKALTPFIFLKQLLFLLKRIFSSDLFLCQFSGYHSFLPVVFAKLLKKRSVIIAGGVDCVSFPSFNYGNFNKPILNLFTKWSYYMATSITPKHQSLIFTEYIYHKSDYPAQGISYFCKDLKTPYMVIPNGFDKNKWYRNSEKQSNTFITVSSGFQYPFQAKLKGIDLIFEIAPHFPDCRFQILGVTKDFNLKVKSTNVELIPPVSHDELINYYSKAEFYMQLSIAEGFPNALCEAMLCECIPIGSNVFSIPEIIDDTGFVLKTKSSKALTELIQKALSSDKQNLGIKSRNRIAENYSLDNRKRKLLYLIESITP